MDNIDKTIVQIGVGTGKRYTTDQKLLIKDTGTPIISFSKPGVGKTETLVAKIINKELSYQIPGKNMLVISFTKLATGEIETRYKKATQQLGILATAQFRTMHALCVRILSKNYTYLRMRSFDISAPVEKEELHKFVLNICKKNDIQLHPNKVSQVLNCIDNLNSALIFDRRHVEAKYIFQALGLSYEEFTLIRKKYYELSRATNCIKLNDILLYTLELFIQKPELSETYKNEIKELYVDEVQDFSLLQVDLLSRMCATITAIGDIDQQIYAFNGACPQIVDRLKDYYPELKEINLIDSFRCCDEIAEYANKIIKHNYPNGAEIPLMKGNGTSGKCEIHKNYNITKVVQDIFDELVANNNRFTKDTMFLYRNKYYAAQVIEELYKKKIPFRSDKFIEAYKYPVISDICAVIRLAKNPFSLDDVYILRKLIPEFYKIDSLPHYDIMKKQGCNVFQVQYEYEDPDQAREAFDLLEEVREKVFDDAKMTDLVKLVVKYLNDIYYEWYERYMDLPVQTYLDIVTPLLDKTFEDFLVDENEKRRIIGECNKEKRGIRCYTMHSAKGTEADRVYILYANEGCIPNEKEIERMKNAKCYMDAAETIRSERSLVYVSCTRAKEELHICYTESLAPLFKPDENPYAGFDNCYFTNKIDYHDVDAFKEFYK